MHVHIHTHKHTHLLFAGLNTSFFFSSLFKTSPLFPILTDSTKWAYVFDWQPQQTLPPPLPLPSPPPPRFNPLPIPLSLPPSPFPLLFWVTLESRHVSIFSISDCLISRRWHPQLYWHRWWRSRLEQRGGGEKKWLTCVCCCYFPLPPLLRLVCVDTDTSGWHWHTPDTDACQGNIRRIAGKGKNLVVVCLLCVCVCVLLSGFSHLVCWFVFNYFHNFEWVHFCIYFNAAGCSLLGRKGRVQRSLCSCFGKMFNSSFSD